LAIAGILIYSKSVPVALEISKVKQDAVEYSDVATPTLTDTGIEESGGKFSEESFEDKNEGIVIEGPVILAAPDVSLPIEKPLEESLLIFLGVKE